MSDEFRERAPCPTQGCLGGCRLIARRFLGRHRSRHHHGPENKANAQHDSTYASIHRDLPWLLSNNRCCDVESRVPRHPSPPSLPSAALHPRRLEQRRQALRSEEHTSELQSLMRISYAVFCLKKKTK